MRINSLVDTGELEKDVVILSPEESHHLARVLRVQPGQEIIIRGHRFGVEEEAGDIIFPPGLVGRIIYWRNNRIRVEVPPGAQTGAVVVKTRCATSNGDFLKIGSETEQSTSGGIQEWN